MTGRGIALTRPVSRTMPACELTHLAREPIDIGRANRQHGAYEKTLETQGYQVRRLPELPDHPDSVFIEDTLVVLDGLAVVTRPGASSRRGETVDLAHFVADLRPVITIEAPGTLDGGDVLRLGRTLLVGLSARTNAAGVAQLSRAAEALGYEVRTVAVDRCLHLKSAASAVDDNRVLANPAWIDVASLGSVDTIAIDPSEPFAANVLRAGDGVILPAAHARTGKRLEAEGLTVVPVDLSEIAKAEGGVTCCSVLIDQASSRSS